MRYLILLLLFAFQTTLNGQTDLQSWSSVKLYKKTESGYSFSLVPIVRHEQNLGDYTSTSFDLSISKGLSKGWRVQYLYRYWYVDEGPNRVFWWFDVSNKQNLSAKLSLQNRLRWHLALDGFREDPNFLRYLPTLKYKISSFLSAYTGLELWWQLDGINAIRRFRPQAGFSVLFSNRVSFDFQYWYEKSTGLDPGFLFHTLVFNLNYSL